MRRSAHHYIRVLARLGYVAKAITYVLLALMVLRAARTGDRPATTRRAMDAVADGSIVSEALLAAIGMGLAGYAVWKIYTAIRNPEHDRWTKRTGGVFIAGVNAGLAVQAFMLAASSRPHASNGDQAMHWSAIVMRYPAGIWAVGIAGACIAGYGLRQIYRGITADLDDQLSLQQVSAVSRRWVTRVARTGVAARGFVFTLIGVFLARAALRADPSQARDFGDSMQELERQAYGHWLLVFMAAGLLSYAVYELLRARYRSIPTR